MKAIYKSIVISAFALSASLSAVAQSKNMLPAPVAGSEMKLSGAPAAMRVGDVLYGAVPANSSTKPVLLFIHGYSSSAETWYVDNDMYAKAYAAGYRTAFVSVNPDKTVWVNGQMFAGMINTVAAYYGVAKVTIVAHSKGGVDTDAALVHYGAHTKVQRVITLSSPHYGTPLADLAHSSWTWWLAAIFGQANDATHSLQTGSMSYFRSVTDVHANSSKVDFRTIGGWGYFGWTFATPGAYLNLNGGGSGTGGNDGVVPYYSSKRPKSITLLPGYGDSRSDVDHSEVKTGSNMWNYVKSALPSGLTREDASSEQSKVTNPNAVVSSSTQIVSSKSGDKYFVIEQGAANVSLDIRMVNENAKFKITDAAGNEAQMRKISPAVKLNNDILGAFSRVIETGKIAPGVYKIVASDPYIAIIAAEGGVKATLTSDLSDDKFVYASGETMNLKVNLSSVAKIDLEGAKINGLIRQTTDLKGGLVQNGDALPVTFAENGTGEYAYTVTQKLAPGVYNISLNIEGEGYRKSLTTSVAVTEAKAAGKDAVAEKSFALIQNYPNPFSGSTKISCEITKKGDYTLTVFDMFGKTVKVWDMPGQEAGMFEAELNSDGLGMKSGMYVYQLTDGKERATGTMVFK